MTELVLFLNLWGWLERLGGLGLILLGVVDNSPFPVPGSMDALTVILSAHQKEWWPYYAAMATAGGTLGAYLAYALGKEGEEEALEKRLPRQKAEKIRRIFDRYGFWSIFVPALLPPPFPFSPFPFGCRHREVFAQKVPDRSRWGARNSLLRVGIPGFPLQQA